MNKTLIILRSVPGAGKSSVAQQLELICGLGNVKFTLCCADEYFEDVNGDYKYIPEKIGNAHLWCQDIFNRAIKEEQEFIVVANTSTRAKDVSYYRDIAIEANYRVYVLVVENWHEGTDIHNVPIDVKEKMKISLMNSIKL